MPFLNTKFRTALVTGASSGLGRCITEMLLHEGIRVWGTARRAEAVGPFTTTGFERVALDLRDVGGARAAVRRAEAAAGGCFDLVVINAGYGLFAPFADAEWQGWEDQLQALVVTNTGVVHQLTSAMVARGRGCVVIVTAPAGRFQTGLRVAQSALVGLASCLNKELSPHGVQVLNLQCGWLRTDFINHMPVARIVSVRPDDVQLVPEWKRLLLRMKEAPGPDKTVAYLREALLQENVSGVVRLRPRLWRRWGHQLLVGLGVRSKAENEEAH